MFNWEETSQLISESPELQQLLARQLGLLHFLKISMCCISCQHILVTFEWENKIHVRSHFFHPLTTTNGLLTELCHNYYIYVWLWV